MIPPKKPRVPRCLEISIQLAEQLDQLEEHPYNRNSGDVSLYLESIAETIGQVINGVTAKQAEEWYGERLKYKRQIADKVYAYVRKKLKDCASKENTEFSKYLYEVLKQDMQDTAEVVGNNVTWSIKTNLGKTEETRIGWRLYFRKIQNQLWRVKSEFYKDSQRYLRAEWARYNYYSIERAQLIKPLQAVKYEIVETNQPAIDNNETVKYAFKICPAAWDRLKQFAECSSMMKRPEFIRLCIDAYIHKIKFSNDNYDVSDVIRHCFSAQRGKNIKQGNGIIQLASVEPIQVLHANLRVLELKNRDAKTAKEPEARIFDVLGESLSKKPGPFYKSIVLGSEILELFPTQVLEPFRRRMRNREERFMRIVGVSYTKQVLGVTYKEEPLEQIFEWINKKKEEMKRKANEQAKKRKEEKLKMGISEEAKKLIAVRELEIALRKKVSSNLDFTTPDKSHSKQGVL